MIWILLQQGLKILTILFLGLIGLNAGYQALVGMVMLARSGGAISNYSLGALMGSLLTFFLALWLIKLLRRWRPGRPKPAASV